jgi:UDP-glucose 4-epimerase
LKNKGFYIIGVDIEKQEVSDHQNFVNEYFQSDISKHSFVGEIKSYIQQKNYKISAIFHLAGLKKSSESFQLSDKYWATNFIGTSNMISIAKILNINSFIFSSSCSVYGNLDDEFISEDSLTIPISPYGNSKLAAEKMLLDQSLNSFNLIILRFFNVAGCTNNFPDQSETNIFPKLTEAYLKDESFVIYGDNYMTSDGTCVRDYVHVQDIVDAHVLSLERLETTNNFSEIINIGSQNGYSVKELIKRFEKILNYRFKIFVNLPRMGDPTRAVSSFEKAKTIINYKPKLELIDMVTSHLKATKL